MEAKNNIHGLKNEAWQISRTRIVIEVIAIIASAVLYATSFPPFNWSVSAWCALVPFYFVIKSKRPIHAFLYGILWGYTTFLISFFWLYEIEFFIPFIMAFVLGTYPAIWGYFVSVFRRSIVVPVAVTLQGSESVSNHKPSFIRESVFIFSSAALWCLLEWVRSWFLSGLPWNFTGSSQWLNIPVIQICEYTGVYGISFIIIFFNLALASAIESLLKVFHSGEKYRRPIPMIIALILLMTAVLTGARSMMKYRMAVKDAASPEKQKYVPFTATVIQGDIAQCRLPKQGEAENALQVYVDLSELALYNKSDIVIWSETAVPVPYRTGYEFGDMYRFKLFQLMKKGKRPFLIGTIDYEYELLDMGVPPSKVPCHNSAFLLDTTSDNTFFVKEKYNKIHLVPFGEYTPLGKYFPELKKALGMGRDLTPGKRYTIFNLKKGVRAGVNICFEDVFPEISANLAKRGANILVVLTNDAWYPTSSESEQHLANAVFRAVETRLPMIRAGNNNCSCLILPNGAIVDSVSVKADGTIDPTESSRGYADFKIDVLRKPKLTFYTRFPHCFIWLCGLIVFAAALYSISVWREKKQAYTEMFENS